ncbi:MAG TPA: ATP-binding protein [Chloroflexia bacterium]|nr:ATP-binding protein [Chloroflexia bacterium]
MVGTSSSASNEVPGSPSPAATPPPTALELSEARYRALVEATAQILWITDPRGTVDDMPGWRAYTGQTVEEVRRDAGMSAVHPDDRARVVALWQQALANRSLYEAQYRLRRADGVYEYFSSSGVPVRDADGRIREWVGTCTNIQVQKEIEQERARYFEAQQRAHGEAAVAQDRLAFLAEASALLASSLDYQTTLKNLATLVVPYLADWCTVDLLDEAGGISRVAVFHADPEKLAMAEEYSRRFPTDPNAPRGVAHVLRSGRSEVLPEIPDAVLDLAVPNPELRELVRRLGVRSSICVPLVARGRTLGALTLVAEVARRYGDAELTVAEELARRAAVAVDNAWLFGDLQRAVQAREDFLSIASHELKTPLTSLQLQVQMLLRAAHKGTLTAQNTGRAVRMLETAERQVKQLVRLINDLLDVSRLQAGKMDVTVAQLDLVALVREVATRFAPQLAMAGCGLVFDAPEPVPGWWDAARLDQVVTNLLSNAVKYGRGRPITISVIGGAEAARLTVRDEGIGISPDAQQRIFGRFERAVSTHEYGGLGLGLYIASQIVEASGGTIGVSSAPGAGAAFTVTLPYQPAPPTGVASAVAEEPQS